MLHQQKPEFEPQSDISNIARPSSQYCNCTKYDKTEKKICIKNCGGGLLWWVGNGHGRWLFFEEVGCGVGWW